MNIMKYVLTDEGRKYLAEGLPEKNLIDILKKGPVTFAEAQGKVANFSIALMWAKKNGWIKINGQYLEIAVAPDHMPEERALRDAEEGNHLDDKIISVLLQRKLIAEEREDIVKKATKMAGKEITSLTPELIKTGLWRKSTMKPYNVSAVGKKIYPGKRQPYNQFLMHVRRKLVELGFVEMTGPSVETEFWNFDALYQPQNHPSRDWTQTYSMKCPQYGSLPHKDIVEKVKAAHESGWKTGSTGWGYEWNEKKASRLMPRAHDTAISPRYLSGTRGKIEIPGKYFNMVRCYRPDIIDATHGVEFIQTGGFIIADDLSMRDLMGLLKQFACEIAGAKDVKFTTGYFPFTEPSCEVSIKHPELGWMEIAGSGIFREELTKPLGIDATVMAWGFGVDRLAMHKLKINDIRELFSRNLDWLRKMTVL
jgi:phenylalanyl-tRNA synthetase alpha chain